MSVDLLNQSRAIAESLLADIVWTSADAGYCRCPGYDLHRKSTNGKRDCIVRLGGDRPPTIFCVHRKRCVDVVAERNHHFRSAIGKAKWEIARGEDPTLPVRPQLTRAEQLRRGRQRRLDDLAARARRALPTILRDYRWPVADIAADSPDDTMPGWRALFSLFEPGDVLWTGDRKDSGAPAFAEHFRSAADWLRGDQPTGPLLSAACWKPGCFRRSADQIARAPFLVVESDVLGKDDISAVFRWCHEDGLTLRAVIDTAGKGLHGWFDRPTNPKRLEERITALTALGCDPGPMRIASMSRLPGAWRDGRQQRLLWINPDSEGVRACFTFSRTRALAGACSSFSIFSSIEKKGLTVSL